MLLGAVKIYVDLVRSSEILSTNEVAMYQFRSTMGKVFKAQSQSIYNS